MQNQIDRTVVVVVVVVAEIDETMVEGMVAAETGLDLDGQ
jgi:hypothetical protein